MIKSLSKEWKGLDPNNTCRIMRLTIKIFLKEHCEDPRLVNFQIERDFDYTQKELDAFLDTLNRKYYSQNAEKLVNFFLEYDGGVLLPDKYGEFYGTAKEEYRPSDKDELISLLAFTGYGKLWLRKKRCYDASFQNSGNGFLWEDGKPKRAHPSYLNREGQTEIFIDPCKSSKLSFDFWKGFIEDLGRSFHIVEARIHDMDIGDPKACLREKFEETLIYEYHKTFYS